ncbi:MAG: hypothetical protein ABI566_05115 [Pseudolysinimonas sp.]
MLRITPLDGQPWDVAVGAPNWWRTPVPTEIAFISDGHGFVVDVVTHEVRVDVPGVIRITEDERHDLVLLIEDGVMTAVGPHGIRWRSDLAIGDLKVRAIDARGIRCSGFLTQSDVYRGIPTLFIVEPNHGTLVRVE